MSVSAVGYLRIASTDTSAWMDFGTGVLGLMDAQRADDAGRGQAGGDFMRESRS